MTGKSVDRSARGPHRDGKGRFTRTPDTAGRDAEAATLRTRGWTYPQIAEHMGYADHGGARKAVERAMLAVVAEPAEQALQMELTRLDLMWQAAIAVLEANHYVVSQGRLIFLGPAPLADNGPVLHALDRMLKIGDQRAKLLGLYAPVKSRVEVVTQDVVDAEIQRLAQQVEDAARAGVSGEPAPAD